MRVFAFLILVVGACTRTDGPAAASAPPNPVADEGRAPRPLTLEEALAVPSLAGVAPSQPAWSPDGRHLAFLWNDEGRPERALWVVSPEGADQRRVGSNAGLPVSGFAWTPDGRRLVSLRGAELWSSAVDGEEDVRVATVGTGATDLSVSPDGRKAAFLRDGDLWLADLDEGTVDAATEVGLPPLSALALGRYRRPEREIGPGIWGGPTYAWSPDGRFIAVHHVDRRGVRKVPFPDYLADETDPNVVRRGYPGDANERRRVGLLRVADRTLRFLPLEGSAENQIVSFVWSPANVLLVDRASDDATDRWLHTFDPGTDELRLFWHSHRATRIYTSFASAWHPDGERVLFVSDLGDRYGLYAIDPGEDEAEPERLTDPGYDVLGAPIAVPRAGAIYFEGNGTGSHERHVYRLDAAGESVRITTMPGDNRGVPSPDGRHLAILHSDDVSPPELYVRTLKGPDRRVTTSPRPAFRERAWVRGRYVRFPSRIDDHELHARILEPAARVPGREYPVVFGPVYSNTARNRWSGRYGLIQQLMVQRGYIVVQVDVRGSTGQGRAFREAFLADFAGDDLEDLASAVAYMKTLPYVDPDRFGIWGSSYGGTLALYSLLKKPGLFRAGVAAAAAVDPHFFGPDDVAVVRRPTTHPEIFRREARRYAPNLQDHLLLIHGMQDQVVPFKTAVVVADALIAAGKDFDFAIGPRATHAWSREAPYARFLFGKLLAHFDRHLAPDVAVHPAR